MNAKTRVRFAPSPTGSLHLGGARTALYNYLFAKVTGGEFILRIEDTDQERSTPEALASQIADLTWLGIKWGEGYQKEPEGNNYGPYIQSKRLGIYQKYADQLINEKKAYYCFLTDDEIATQKVAAIKNSTAFHIDSPYKDMSADEAKAKIAGGAAATVRFNTINIKNEYVIDDMVRGKITLPSSMIGDFVILRSDGMPVYNFCCAVDDALMKITHVLRGEEHLSNTLRQCIIYEALNFIIPKFAHLSLIMNEEHKKLSKRDGDVSCNHFREQGFLPSAIINYITLLGWSDPNGEEIFSMDYLEKNFTVKNLHHSAPTFDQKKLNWLNSQHIKMLSDEEKKSHIFETLEQHNITVPSDEAWQQSATSLIAPELTTLNDAIELFNVLVTDNISHSDDLTQVLAWEGSLNAITLWYENIKDNNDLHLESEDVKTIIAKIKQELSLKGKELFMPLRIAILGKPNGPDLKAVTPLITLAILKSRAIKLLNK
jgi:nondiscriminating glutamyl-tRNA synthetase